MAEPDTAALRTAADDAEQAVYAVSVSLHPATVRALCDGYDEAQRLRAALTADVSNLGALSIAAMERRHIEAERDAARQALAELIEELRGLCDDPKQPGDAVWTDDLRAVIDRHAPTETPQDDRPGRTTGTL